MRFCLFFRLALSVVGALAASGIAHAQSPEWHLVEDLRIGALDGLESLNEVIRLTVSPDGRVLYVVQRGTNAIWTYDTRSGRRTGVIGRSGRGPGEFSAPPTVGWRADTLYAADQAEFRVSLFAQNGELLRAFSVRGEVIPETNRRGSPIAYSSFGTVVVSAPIGAREIAEGLVTSSPILLVSGAGTPVRVLAARDLRNTMTYVPFGQGGFFVSHPMSQRTYFGFDPQANFLVIVHQPAGTDPPGRFQVVKLRLTGDTIYSRTYRYDPKPVSRMIVDSIRSEGANATGTPPGWEQALALRQQHLAIPAYHPPITSEWGTITVQTDGTAWLQQEDLRDATARWIVLDPDGAIRANATTPRNLRILYADESTVWGTVLGEFDESYIVRYRIEQ